MKKYELFGLIVLFTTMLSALIIMFTATSNVALMYALWVFTITGLINCGLIVYLDRKYT